MDSYQQVEAKVAQLKRQIVETRNHLADLHEELQRAETNARAARDLDIAYKGAFPAAWQEEVLQAISHSATPLGDGPDNRAKRPLKAEEYRRYGRQLIMPEVGLQGQLRLKSSKVLIVGVGGLGCPAATYLAGAGVGTLGLIDGDVVEVSNLHRQIAHSTSRTGQPKVQSAVSYLADLNPEVKYIPYHGNLAPQTAVQVFGQYDMVLDCTDHPTSRYLISDACVLAGKPLVSASALKTDGQLMVLNNPPKPPGDLNGSPCYRCVWPTPPPPETVVSCGEGGILGPVVGVMGVLQALEALKIIVADIQAPASTSNGINSDATSAPSLLMFSAFSNPPFRSVRIRSRRADCAVCSNKATITAESLTSGSMDYVAFCGANAPVALLHETERLAPEEISKALSAQPKRATVVDTRSPTEFQLCNIEDSVNVPWSEFPSTLKHAAQFERPQWLDADNLVFVCKLGNDSQMAANMVKESGLASGTVFDMRDGFRAWRRDVDPDWPDY